MKPSYNFFYNAYSYTEGNPYLRPSSIDNFEIQHEYKNFLFSSLSYTHTHDGRGNSPFFNNYTKILQLYDMNFYSSDVFNLTETFIYNKLNWLESLNTINISYNRTNFYPDLNL